MWTNGRVNAQVDKTVLALQTHCLAAEGRHPEAEGRGELGLELQNDKRSEEGATICS